MSGLCGPSPSPAASSRSASWSPASSARRRYPVVRRSLPGGTQEPPLDRRADIGIEAGAVREGVLAARGHPRIAVVVGKLDRPAFERVLVRLDAADLLRDLAVDAVVARLLILPRVARRARDLVVRARDVLAQPAGRVDRLHLAVHPLVEDGLIARIPLQARAQRRDHRLEDPGGRVELPAG